MSVSSSSEASATSLLEADESLGVSHGRSWCPAPLPEPRGRRVASYRRPVKRNELICDIRTVLRQLRPTLANEAEETLFRLSYRVWMVASGAARHAADSGFC